MEGMATLTMVTSIRFMKLAISSTASASQRRGSASAFDCGTWNWWVVIGLLLQNRSAGETLGPGSIRQIDIGGRMPRIAQRALQLGDEPLELGWSVLWIAAEADESGHDDQREHLGIEIGSVVAVCDTF